MLVSIKNQRLTSNLQTLQTGNQDTLDHLNSEVFKKYIFNIQSPFSYIFCLFSMFKLSKKQEELSRLREEILNAELKLKEQVKEKTHMIEQLTNETNQKSFKVSRFDIFSLLIKP